MPLPEDPEKFRLRRVLTYVFVVGAILLVLLLAVGAWFVSSLGTW